MVAIYTKLPVELINLRKGTLLVVARQNSSRGVSAGFFVSVGSRHETARRNGIAHFIEHMLFKGTKRRSPYEITASVEGKGGCLNAYTCEDHTCFYGRVPAEQLFSLLDVLADMYLNTLFDPIEVEKERAVILDEIAMVKDQPHQWIDDLLSEALWPGHPLGKPLTGTVRSIKGLTITEIVDFYRYSYVAQNLVIIIVGPVDCKACLDWAERFERKNRIGQRASAEPASRAGPLPRQKVIVRAVEQAQLAIGFRAASRFDADRHALRIANVVLGENMSSRLFYRLREEQGLAYAVSSTLNYFEDCGELVITAAVDPKDAEKCISIIAEELRRLREDHISVAELRRAQQYIIGQTVLNLESTENRMIWLGEQLCAGRVFTDEEQIYREILAVTPRAVKAAARKWFVPDGLAFAAICPRGTNLKMDVLIEALS